MTDNVIIEKKPKMLFDLEGQSIYKLVNNPTQVTTANS